MTTHRRNARKRRSLSRKERSAIVSALRSAAKLAGNDLTLQEMFALATEIERATIIIEVAK